MNPMMNVNVDDSLELLFIPRNNEIRATEGNTLESYENFIDSHVDNIRYENFKTRIFDDVLQKVMECVRKECLTASSFNDRKSKKEDQNELASHLKNEIEFSREEIRQKNIIIQTLATKSVMHEDSVISCNAYNVNSNQTHENLNAVSTKTPKSITTTALTKESLDKQLKSVREKYHDKFIETQHNNIIDKNPVELNNKNENVTNVTKSIKNVMVCGDSILNGLQNNGVSTKGIKTTVRSFSGATSKDMIDFVKPLINKKPDCLILHVGTNDLSKGVGNTCENLQTIVDNVRLSSPGTQIVVSNICLREDKMVLNNKRLSLNKEIEDFAVLNDMTMINNNNIDSACLSRKKLHLNRKGLAKLAVNIKNHISSHISPN